LHAQLTNARESRDALHADLAAAREQLERLQQDTSARDAGLVHLQSQLSDAEARVEASLAAASSLAADKAALIKQLAELQAVHASSQQEVTSLGEQLEHAQAALAASQERLESAHAVIASLQSTIEGLRSRVGQAHEDHADMQEMALQLQGAQAELLTARDQLQQLHASSARLAATEEQVSALQEERLRLLAALAEQQVVIEAHEEAAAASVAAAMDAGLARDASAASPPRRSAPATPASVRHARRTAVDASSASAASGLTSPAAVDASLVADASRASTTGGDAGQIKRLLRRLAAQAEALAASHAREAALDERASQLARIALQQQTLVQLALENAEAVASGDEQQAAAVPPLASEGDARHVGADAGSITRVDASFATLGAADRSVLTLEASRLDQELQETLGAGPAWQLAVDAARPGDDDSGRRAPAAGAAVAAGAASHGSHRLAAAPAALRANADAPATGAGAAAGVVASGAAGVSAADFSVPDVFAAGLQGLSPVQLRAVQQLLAEAGQAANHEKRMRKMLRRVFGTTKHLLVASDAVPPLPHEHISRHPAVLLTPASTSVPGRTITGAADVANDAAADSPAVVRRSFDVREVDGTHARGQEIILRDTPGPGQTTRLVARCEFSAPRVPAVAPAAVAAAGTP